jgi:hypothetical protein
MEDPSEIEATALNSFSGAAQVDGAAIAGLAMGRTTSPSDTIPPREMDLDQPGHNTGSGSESLATFLARTNMAREPSVAGPSPMPPSNAPIFNQTAGPSSGTTQGTIGRRHEESVDPPHQNTALVPTAPTLNTNTDPAVLSPSSTTRGSVPRYFDDLRYRAPPERVSTTPTIQPTSNPTTGVSSSVIRTNVEVVVRGGGGSAHPQGNPLSLGSPSRWPKHRTSGLNS